MRRFGSRQQFLDLCDRIRALAPEAGIRSNVIVGFPGETDDDLAELEEFLDGARLDAVGVFGYSDEDGTEAAGYDGKLPAEEIAARVDADHGADPGADGPAGRRPGRHRGHRAGRAGRGRRLRVHRPRGRTRPRRSTASASSSAGPACSVGRPGALRRHRHRGRGPAGRTAGGLPRGTLSWPPRAASGSSAGTGGVSSPPGPGAAAAQHRERAHRACGCCSSRSSSLALFVDAGQSVGWRLAASGVFAVAAITDRFDGQLARSRGLVTAFGTSPTRSPTRR